MFKYTVVSGLLFGIIAVIHVARALGQWQMQIGAFVVPVWASWIAAVITGGLCVWAFRSRR